MLEVLKTEFVYCQGLGAGVDEALPNVISALVNIIKIGVPILLIIFGMLDMGKAVMSNDEKEMKSAQGILIKRFIYAIIIFFIVAIVQFAVGLLEGKKADTGNTSGTTACKYTCIQCFINGSSQCDKNYCE